MFCAKRSVLKGLFGLVPHVLLPTYRPIGQFQNFIGGSENGSEKEGGSEEGEKAVWREDSGWRRPDRHLTSPLHSRPRKGGLTFKERAAPLMAQPFFILPCRNNHAEFLRSHRHFPVNR